MHKSKAEYMLWRKKTNKLQVHPYSSGDFPLIRGFPTHQGISPEEWATTKQPCRDVLEVYLFFSSTTTYMYTYIHVYMCINIKDEYYSFKK